ncbi:unnamed protein product [Spirodela intermedia]|uniref:Uncharacterized protein n=1 Tax=Spirodela intermedia TaxID=51605 RepID=A0A7I8IUP1_SPIIN|nr:unnamed protein product [Spirodela intermedia]CAA6661548.1 unnamed protein product [Spirodela intermedia]
MHGRRSLHPRLENPFIISFKNKKPKEKLILIDPEGSTGQTENNPMAMKNSYIPDSFQRASNIRVPVAPNVKFEINPRIFQMLPNFHGLPLEEPHQHLEKFHMICDLVNLPQVTPEIIKMKLFPHTLRDKASHWLSTLDRELTSWKDIEQAFLQKFIP